MECIIPMSEVFEDQTNYRSGRRNCGWQSLENTPLLQFASLFLRDWCGKCALFLRRACRDPTYFTTMKYPWKSLGSLENLILRPKRAMGTEHSKTHEHWVIFLLYAHPYEAIYDCNMWRKKNLEDNIQDGNTNIEVLLLLLEWFLPSLQSPG